LILSGDEIEDLFVLSPKPFLESHYDLIENSESDFTNGTSVNWRKARGECNHLLLQNSQRYTHNDLFAVEVLSVPCSHFNNISGVVNLGDEMFEVDFSFFATFFIERFQQIFIASNDDDILGIFFFICNVLVS